MPPHGIATMPTPPWTAMTFCCGGPAPTPPRVSATAGLTARSARCATAPLRHRVPSNSPLPMPRYHDETAAPALPPARLSTRRFGPRASHIRPRCACHSACAVGHQRACAIFPGGAPRVLRLVRIQRPRCRVRSTATARALPQSDPGRLPCRPQHRRCQRQVLSGQFQLHLLPGHSRVREHGPGALDADRQRH
ncbi:hypothetical protein D3C81_1718740 [compost metagenome]